jgi:predicted phosphodiesterase
MIAFIGDVHRAFNRLAGAVASLTPDVEFAIQVGDLGLHSDDLGSAGAGVPPLARVVYYVTGNHDHEPSYRGIAQPTEMAPNLVFVPRGTVLELSQFSVVASPRNQSQTSLLSSHSVRP